MTATQERPVRPMPPAPPWAGDWRDTWAAVWRGEEPAETLPSLVRASLFRSMAAEGMTPDAIGAWTRTTQYTVVRMLDVGSRHVLLSSSYGR